MFTKIFYGRVDKTLRSSMKNHNNGHFPVWAHTVKDEMSSCGEGCKKRLINLNIVGRYLNKYTDHCTGFDVTNQFLWSVSGIGMLYQIIPIWALLEICIQQTGKAMSLSTDIKHHMKQGIHLVPHSVQTIA